MASPCGHCILPVNKGIWAHNHCYPNPFFLSVENGHMMCLLAWINSGEDINHDQFQFDYMNYWLPDDYEKELPLGIQNLVHAYDRAYDAFVHGVTPLLYAVAVGKKDFVRVLVNSGAKHFTRNSTVTPLQLAAILGRSELIELLVNAGGDLEEHNMQNGKTLLMLAASSGEESCMKALLKAGCGVNSQTKDGATAIRYAVNRGTTQLLLDAGAEIDAEDVRGCTPIMYAVLENRPDVLELLLQAGANVNHRTFINNTALIFAATYGLLQCVKLLIHYNAEIDVTGKYRSSPLIDAASHGYTKIVKVLLHLNAKINICSNNRFKALKAQISGNEECICLMFAAGEKLRNTEATNVPDIVKVENKGLDLKHLCRKSIRKHLLDINPNEHLFKRIPKIGFPSIINDYLLYETSIEKNCASPGLIGIGNVRRAVAKQKLY